MKNKASALRAIVCALMLIGILSFVVSSFIPGVCADHDCAGERCFICLCASIQKNLSRIFIIAAGMLAILAPALLSSNQHSQPLGPTQVFDIKPYPDLQ